MDASHGLKVLAEFCIWFATGVVGISFLLQALGKERSPRLLMILRPFAGPGDRDDRAE
jgi:hypothetical protein